LIDIARVQVAREEALHAEAEQAVFCDTSPLSTLGYAHWMFGVEPPELAVLARRAYDLTVLCAPDFDFVQDGTRREPAFRLQQQAWYEARLAGSGGRRILSTGPLEQRIAQVVEAMTRL
jgi:HTH-type transcriptional regulator, transcriptional repressor of NAD biosynthesis genes